MNVEQLVLELQSHIRQLGLAVEYASQRLQSSPTCNVQDLSMCAAMSQHLYGAREICEVLVSHAGMTERMNRTPAVER
jgi:hypothetical protein